MSRHRNCRALSGVYRVPGQTFANLINPKYLSSPTGGGASAQYIIPTPSPGTIGNVVYLHGPRQFYQDISLTKTIPIHERVAIPPAGLIPECLEPPCLWRCEWEWICRR